jgi:hypothetical protein
MKPPWKCSNASQTRSVNTLKRLLKTKTADSAMKRTLMSIKRPESACKIVSVQCAVDFVRSIIRMSSRLKSWSSRKFRKR